MHQISIYFMELVGHAGHGITEIQAINHSMGGAVNPHDTLFFQCIEGTAEILDHGVFPIDWIVRLIKCLPLADDLLGDLICFGFLEILFFQVGKIPRTGGVILMPQVCSVEYGLRAVLLDCTVKLQNILGMLRGACPIPVKLFQNRVVFGFHPKVQVSRGIIGKLHKQMPHALFVIEALPYGQLFLENTGHIMDFPI